MRVLNPAFLKAAPKQLRLRAIIEILDDGHIRILPVAESDRDAKAIEEVLRELRNG